ncbi:hypothetical protein T484DRAFT_1770680 [Baffinella frigidus]|nr:hypothetical protein T484DRAFT_1770680 [Cryptophyta sp. CCMP2293]
MQTLLRKVTGPGWETGTTAGSFSACLAPTRADGALLEAAGAGGALLEASTGSVLFTTGFESATLLPPAQASGNVAILSAGIVSVSAGTSQSCGVMSNGTAVCWGKAEAHYTYVGPDDGDVDIWRCGYMARYFRFRPLESRGGTLSPPATSRLPPCFLPHAFVCRQLCVIGS